MEAQGVFDLSKYREKRNASARSRGTAARMVMGIGIAPDFIFPELLLCEAPARMVVRIAGKKEDEQSVALLLREAEETAEGLRCATMLEDPLAPDDMSMIWACVANQELEISGAERAVSLELQWEDGRPAVTCEFPREKVPGTVAVLFGKGGAGGGRTGGSSGKFGAGVAVRP